MLRFLHHLGDGKDYLGLLAFQSSGKCGALVLKVNGKLIKLLPVHLDHVAYHVETVKGVGKHEPKHGEYTLGADSVLLNNYLTGKSQLKFKELIFVIILKALDVGADKANFSAVLVDAAYAVNLGVRDYLGALFADSVDYLLDILHGVHGVYHIYQHEYLAEILGNDVACNEILLRLGKGRQCGSHVNNSVRLDKKVLYLIVKVVKVAETRSIDYLYLLEDRCIAAHIKIIQLAGEEIQQTRKPVTAQVVLGKGNTLAVFEHSLHRRALTV